ncbi:phosphotransferase family protein [Nocardioides sp.]|uniref:phosphotransferase family protein n=1 Tax=Nocardioides sp. TaxID=35761 RepID=UPI00271DF781|nr:phosphotransferase [Nocardioides sp.]MDO9457618.1 phosphotransferase [Nocardioides sp.]
MTVVGVESLTPEWLSSALGGHVDAVSVSQVGTGQMGECYRLALTGDGVPVSVLAKLGAADPAARAIVGGAYRGEVRFYAEVAPTVAIRVPDCLHAAYDDDTAQVVLLLEDLAAFEQGDQLAGCSPAAAHDAAANLAGLHGPRWCDPTLLELDTMKLNQQEDADLLAEFYGSAVDLYLSDAGVGLSAEDRATLAATVPVAGDWLLARADRFALVHGDYRLDNLMFRRDGEPGCVAVDWQTTSLAPPVRDLGFLLGTGLTPALRREHERAVVATYHSSLLGFGVADYELDECWLDYRVSMLQGPLIAVFGYVYTGRTERGDRMFATMVERSCAAIRDLETLALVRP